MSFLNPGNIPALSVIDESPVQVSYGLLPLKYG
jgi:hypothetical protein